VRLREIQRHIKAAQVPNKAEFEGPISGTAQYRLTNMRAWRRAIMYFNEVEVFAPFVEDLLEDQAITESITDVVVGLRHEIIPTYERLQKLGRGLHELLLFLEKALPPQQPHTLVIQIPPPESLQSLAGLADDLAKFFTVAARAEQEEEEATIGTPTVQAFDSGSFYLEVLLATTAGVATIGLITSAAFRFLRQYQSFIATQQTLRAFKAISADIESIQKQNELARSAFLQAEVQALQAKRFPKAQQEAQAALLAAIQESAKLMEKGVKMLPPVSSNREVEKTFPSADELKLLAMPEIQKLLEPSNSGEPSTAPTKNNSPSSKPSKK
jgi:hypothetical protein